MSALLSVSVFTAFRLFAAADFAHCLAVPFQIRPHCVKSRTSAAHLHRNRCNTLLPPVLCISIVFPTDHKICIITKYLSVVCKYDVFIRCTQCIVRKPLHLIFAVGWYTVAHQKSRTASAIRHYTESRGNTPLRPHLVTIRIYLLIALFIICILDFLCIRQCLMHFDYAVLTLGTVSTLCTLIGVISLISCIVLFRHCSKK